jgi:hypothetical protein
MVGSRWNLELREVLRFSSLGAFKIYANLWEGRNQMILI